MSTVAQTATVKKAGIGGLTVFLGVISSMLFLDTIAPSANMGPQVVSWYIIFSILFFIPMGYIIGELAAAYPDKGGVYGWIKKAYGDRWAGRTSWVYWINAALWTPATIIFLTGVTSQLVWPEAGIWFNVILGVILSWVIVYISSLTVEESGFINNIGGAIKLLLPVLLLAASLYYVLNYDPATSISFSSVLPNFAEGLDFLPVVIYNMCGLEIILGNVHKFNNPSKDVPKSVISGAVVMSLIYVVSAIAILLIIPVEEVGVVKGFLDAFITVLGEGTLATIAIFGIGILFIGTIVLQVQQWSLGSCIVAAESSEAKELPKAFQKYNKNESPIGALIITGIVSSSVIIIYGLMAETAEDLFWMLFEFSSMLFLMPYIVLVFAFAKLRKTDAQVQRPFKVPFGDAFANILAWFMALILVVTIILFIWVPGYPIDWGYTIPVVVGVVVALIAGEIIVSRTMKQA
jgi:amino acid transporter